MQLNIITVYYSNSNESGYFTTDGITSIKSNNTFVQCTSNHLAWFAVIVDVSGVSLSFLHG